MGLIAEFKDFLKEYKITGLAIAFIIGGAAVALVKSIVDNVIMPLIGPLIPGGEWQSAVWNIGPFAFGWGPFLAALINFVIIAFVVFIFARFVLKEEKVSKK